MTTKAQMLASTSTCVEEQPLDGLVDDPDAGDDQEEGLDEGGEVLDLAVAVGVVLVGGTVGDVDGQEGDDGGHQVEAGVGGLGQHPEAAGHEADDELDDGEENGRPDGAGGGGLFLGLGRGLAGTEAPRR